MEPTRKIAAEGTTPMIADGVHQGCLVCFAALSSQKAEDAVLVTHGDQEGLWLPSELEGSHD